MCWRICRTARRYMHRSVVTRRSAIPARACDFGKPQTASLQPPIELRMRKPMCRTKADGQKRRMPGIAKMKKPFFKPESQLVIEQRYPMEIRSGLVHLG